MWVQGGWYWVFLLVHVVVHSAFELQIIWKQTIGENMVSVKALFSLRAAQTKRIRIIRVLRVVYCILQDM